MNENTKKRKYKEVITLASLTEDKFMDIVQGMNYDSTSKEGKKLAKAFNKLQEFQSLIFEAQEKAGFGDE